MCITYDNVGDGAASIDEKSELTLELAREFTKRTCQFWVNESLSWNLSIVKILKDAKMIFLQPLCVSMYL